MKCHSGRETLTELFLKEANHLSAFGMLKWDAEKVLQQCGPYKEKERSNMGKMDFGKDNYLKPKTIWEEEERICFLGGRKGGEKRKGRNTKWDKILLFITDITFRSSQWQYFLLKINFSFNHVFGSSNAKKTGNTDFFLSPVN